MINANHEWVSSPGTGTSAKPLSGTKPDAADLLNQGYLCPPDAGPAWRAAHEAGVDMALLEDALRMSPGTRLREHQRALNQVLALIQARASR